jgi:hypothetical protein
MRRHDGRCVVSPSARWTPKSHATGIKWQRDLHGVMRVETRWLTGAAYPQAAAAPQKNASDGAGLQEELPSLITTRSAFPSSA